VGLRSKTSHSFGAPRARTRFADLVETRPEIVAHHYGEAAIADKAITYWHLVGN
jgi:hypothetical protein